MSRSMIQTLCFAGIALVLGCSSTEGELKEELSQSDSLGNEGGAFGNDGNDTLINNEGLSEVNGVKLSTVDVVVSEPLMIEGMGGMGGGWGVTPEIDGPALTTVTAPVYDFGGINTMFKDETPIEVFTANERKFELANVVRVRALGKTLIEVANFAPVDLEDVVVTLSIDDGPQDIVLMVISRLRAHGIAELEYAFLDQEVDFIDLQGDAVDLSEYSENGIWPQNAHFDFTGATEQVQKLLRLKALNWSFHFIDYDKDNDPKNNWAEDVTPRQARLFTSLIINMGYLWVEERFWPLMRDAKLTGNDKALLTIPQKWGAYQRILNKPFYRGGVVANVSGLGGGATFGVANYVLVNAVREGMSSTSTHETAHMIGYSHSSNMTYPSDGVGFGPMNNQLNKLVHMEKGYPVRPDNYYKQGDF